LQERRRRKCLSYLSVAVFGEEKKKVKGREREERRRGEEVFRQKETPESLSGAKIRKKGRIQSKRRGVKKGIQHWFIFPFLPRSHERQKKEKREGGEKIERAKSRRKRGGEGKKKKNQLNGNIPPTSLLLTAKIT